MKIIVFAMALCVSQEGPPSSDTVGRYAAALKDAKTRKRAWDRLAHLGPGVLDPLTRLDIPAEVLASLKAEIAFNETIKHAYGAPRTFTFDGREEPLGTHLSRLEEASGVTFYKQSIDLTLPVALELRDGSFWESVHEICRKAGLLYWASMGDQIHLRTGALPEKPKNYHGPIMIWIDRFVHERRATFDRTSSSFAMQISCVWERHVAPRGLTKNWRLDAIRDDTGKSLMPVEAPTPVPAKIAAAGSRLLPLMVEIPNLQVPDPAAQRISLIQGVLEMEFPARIDVVTFPAPMENPVAAISMEGLRVELRGFSDVASNGVMADVALVYADEKEAVAGGFTYRDAAFVKTDGTRRNAHVTSTSLEGATAGFTLRGYNLGDVNGVKEISLRIPRGAIVKPISFLFENVGIR